MDRGDGQRAAEQIAHDGFLGQAAEDVVPGYVDAVDRGDDRIDQQRVVLDRDAEPVLQQPHADHHFQQGDGYARVEPRSAMRLQLT